MQTTSASLQQSTEPSSSELMTHSLQSDSYQEVPNRVRRPYQHHDQFYGNLKSLNGWIYFIPAVSPYLSACTGSNIFPSTLTINYATQCSCTCQLQQQQQPQAPTTVNSATVPSVSTDPSSSTINFLQQDSPPATSLQAASNSRSRDSIKDVMNHPTATSPSSSVPAPVPCILPVLSTPFNNTLPFRYHSAQLPVRSIRPGTGSRQKEHSEFVSINSVTFNTKFNTAYVPAPDPFKVTNSPQLTPLSPSNSSVASSIQGRTLTSSSLQQQEKAPTDDGAELEEVDETTLNTQPRNKRLSNSIGTNTPFTFGEIVNPDDIFSHSKLSVCLREEKDSSTLKKSPIISNSESNQLLTLLPCSSDELEIVLRIMQQTEPPPAPPITAAQPYAHLFPQFSAAATSSTLSTTTTPSITTPSTPNINLSSPQLAGQTLQSIGRSNSEVSNLSSSMTLPFKQMQMADGPTLVTPKSISPLALRSLLHPKANLPPAVDLAKENEIRQSTNIPTSKPRLLYVHTSANHVHAEQQFYTLQDHRWYKIYIQTQVECSCTCGARVQEIDQHTSSASTTATAASTTAQSSPHRHTLRANLRFGVTPPARDFALFATEVGSPFVSPWESNSLYHEIQALASGNTPNEQITSSAASIASNETQSTSTSKIRKSLKDKQFEVPACWHPIRCPDDITPNSSLLLLKGVGIPMAQDLATIGVTTIQQVATLQPPAFIIDNPKRNFTHIQQLAWVALEVIAEYEMRMLKHYTLPFVIVQSNPSFTVRLDELKRSGRWETRSLQANFPTRQLQLAYHTGFRLMVGSEAPAPLPQIPTIKPVSPQSNDTSSQMEVVNEPTTPSTLHTLSPPMNSRNSHRTNASSQPSMEVRQQSESTSSFNTSRENTPMDLTPQNSTPGMPTRPEHHSIDFDFTGSEEPETTSPHHQDRPVHTQHLVVSTQSQPATPSLQQSLQETYQQQTSPIRPPLSPQPLQQLSFQSQSLQESVSHMSSYPSTPMQFPSSLQETSQPQQQQQRQPSSTTTSPHPSQSPNNNAKLEPPMHLFERLRIQHCFYPPADDGDPHRPPISPTRRDDGVVSWARRVFSEAWSVFTQFKLTQSMIPSISAGGDQTVGGTLEYYTSKAEFMAKAGTLLNGGHDYTLTPHEVELFWNLIVLPNPRETRLAFSTFVRVYCWLGNIKYEGACHSEESTPRGGASSSRSSTPALEEVASPLSGKFPTRVPRMIGLRSVLQCLDIQYPWLRDYCLGYGLSLFVTRFEAEHDLLRAAEFKKGPFVRLRFCEGRFDRFVEDQIEKEEPQSVAESSSTAGDSSDPEPPRGVKRIQSRELRTIRQPIHRQFIASMRRVLPSGEYSPDQFVHHVLFVMDDRVNTKVAPMDRRVFILSLNGHDVHQDFVHLQIEEDLKRILRDRAIDDDLLLKTNRLNVRTKGPLRATENALLKKQQQQQYYRYHGSNFQIQPIPQLNLQPLIPGGQQLLQRPSSLPVQPTTNQSASHHGPRAQSQQLPNAFQPSMGLPQVTPTRVEGNYQMMPSYSTMTSPFPQPQYNSTPQYQDSRGRVLMPNMPDLVVPPSPGQDSNMMYSSQFPPPASAPTSSLMYNNQNNFFMQPNTPIYMMPQPQPTSAPVQQPYQQHMAAVGYYHAQPSPQLMTTPQYLYTGQPMTMSSSSHSFPSPTPLPSAQPPTPSHQNWTDSPVPTSIPNSAAAPPIDQRPFALPYPVTVNRVAAPSSQMRPASSQSQPPHPSHVPLQQQQQQHQQQHQQQQQLGSAARQRAQTPLTPSSFPSAQPIGHVTPPPLPGSLTRPSSSTNSSVREPSYPPSFQSASQQGQQHQHYQQQLQQANRSTPSHHAPTGSTPTSIPPPSAQPLPGQLASTMQRRDSPSPISSTQTFSLPGVTSIFAHPGQKQEFDYHAEKKNQLKMKLLEIERQKLELMKAQEREQLELYHRQQRERLECERKILALQQNQQQQQQQQQSASVLDEDVMSLHTTHSISNSRRQSIQSAPAQISTMTHSPSSSILPSDAYTRTINEHTIDLLPTQQRSSQRTATTASSSSSIATASVISSSTYDEGIRPKVRGKKLAPLPQTFMTNSSFPGEAADESHQTDELIKRKRKQVPKVGRSKGGHKQQLQPIQSTTHSTANTQLQSNHPQQLPTSSTLGHSNNSSQMSVSSDQYLREQMTPQQLEATFAAARGIVDTTAKLYGANQSTATNQLPQQRSQPQSQQQYQQQQYYQQQQSGPQQQPPSHQYPISPPGDSNVSMTAPLDSPVSTHSASYSKSVSDLEQRRPKRQQVDHVNTPDRHAMVKQGGPTNVYSGGGGGGGGGGSGGSGGQYPYQFRETPTTNINGYHPLNITPLIPQPYTSSSSSSPPMVSPPPPVEPLRNPAFQYVPGPQYSSSPQAHSRMILPPTSSTPTNPSTHVDAIRADLQMVEAAPASTIFSRLENPPLIGSLHLDQIDRDRSFSPTLPPDQTGSPGSTGNPLNDLIHHPLMPSNILQSTGSVGGMIGGMNDPMMDTGRRSSRSSFLSNNRQSQIHQQLNQPNQQNSSGSGQLEDDWLPNPLE